MIYKKLFVNLFCLVFGTSSYGMIQNTFKESQSYDTWPSSHYLNQIFSSVCNPKNANVLNQRKHYATLLDHAKQHKYCPETTNVLLQLGSYFLNFRSAGDLAFNKDVVFLIFSYAVQSTAFWPVHYSLSKELFVSSDFIQFDDCMVAIENVNKKHCICCGYQAGQNGFKLTVRLNKNKIYSDVEIGTHISQMRQRFITENNFPENYQVKTIHNLTGKNFMYTLKVTKPAYLCCLPEYPWISSLYYYNNNYNSLYNNSDNSSNYKRGIPIYKNDSLKIIPWTDLGIKSDHTLEKIHFVKIVDKEYLIFKHRGTENTYSKIQIFEITDSMDEEDTNIMKATLVQTILMSFRLKYRTELVNSQWQQFPYASHAEDKEIDFCKGCIFSSKGSFLFFNSILPKKNYSLTKEEEANKYFLAVQKAEEEKCRQKEFENSVEYKNALKHYIFCDILERGGSLVGTFSTLAFMICLLSYVFDDVSTPIYTWTSLRTLLASISVVVLESIYKSKLKKDFSGIADVYEKKYW